MVWDDFEGVRVGNPLCHCDHHKISRGQMEDWEDRRGYVFRCAREKCGFVVRPEEEDDEEEY